MSVSKHEGGRSGAACPLSPRFETRDLGVALLTMRESCGSSARAEFPVPPAALVPAQYRGHFTATHTADRSAIIGRGPRPGHPMTSSDAVSDPKAPNLGGVRILVVEDSWQLGTAVTDLLRDRSEEHTSELQSHSFISY